MYIITGGRGGCVSCCCCCFFFYGVYLIHCFHIAHDTPCLRLPLQIFQNKFCFQFLQGTAVVPRETENNASAKFLRVKECIMGNVKLVNRPLPSSKNPHFQNEARCTTFFVKMSFICMRMKK